MAGFRILPTELRFFEWFNKSADNVFEAARVLHGLLVDHGGIESRVVQLSEIEHQGDLIVHEILDLLSRTFLTPIEDDEIRALTGSLDDVLDHIEATARALLLYKVEQPIPEAMELGRLLVNMTEQIATAVPLVSEKKRLAEIHQYTVEINRLENEADRVHFGALARLVEERGDWFELFRWKEIIEIMEDAPDSCEDVADVLETVVQKSA
jgi:uncharacterized protein